MHGKACRFVPRLRAGILIAAMGGLRRICHGSGLVLYRSPLLEELSIPHAFTTRVGVGGEVLCVRELDSANLAALCDASGLQTGRPRFARQVHGSNVVEVAEKAVEAEADGLTSTLPGTAIGVYTADCVPILLAAEDGSRVAAVHAGWRGLLAGVIPTALARFEGATVVAAIGACLSTKRCEMGPEVSRRFVETDLAESVLCEPGRRDHVDVRGAAVLQLQRAGVQAIDVSEHCTFDARAEFGSHRRDVTHGNQTRATSQGALIACPGAPG